MAENEFEGTEIEKFKDLFKQRTGILPKFVDQKSVREWFVSNMKAITNPVSIMKMMRENPERLLRTGRMSNKVVGSLVMWFYDPKHKKKLPYYDRFPIGFVVGMADGGFYGLNMHYLDPQSRLKLFAALVDIGGRPLMNDKKLQLSYELLKGASKVKLFKPCFKHYLNTHVKSRFYVIPPDEWHIMLAMPNTERFEKGGRGNKGKFGGAQNKYKVWADSRGIAGLRNR